MNKHEIKRLEPGLTHTLQLSVKDFLRECVVDIDRARNAVKVLRAPSFRYKILNYGIPKLQLDVVNRWNSTYNMLKCLLGLKEFCLTHLSSSDQLSNNQWITIENIVSVLQPVHELTLKLQKSQLVLGDFYKILMGLIFKLKTIDTPDKSRQSILLENDTIYAAFFLDPRFRCLLTSTKNKLQKNI
ncbi:hypothetical protein CVS40_4873 [Lucilia cuprina]|nr:hypothetical protein CVS40_4873 [Lucilia cuprina]